jgi:hypothetical protein
MSNEGNYRRRTVVTMVKDRLAMANERIKGLERHQPKFVDELGFWQHERACMTWFLDQLKTRKIGKIPD